MNFADNNILLLLIAMVFIYAVLSIMVSILVEWFNYLTKERGKHLRDSIHNLLTDVSNANLGQLFYDHVTIAGLHSLKKRLPDYISSGMFAEAFVDIIAQQADGTQENQEEGGDLPIVHMFTRFENGVRAMKPSQFRNLLLSFIDKSGNDYNALKKHIENWYNDYMDRVSGWYKLNQRTKLIIAGFAVTLALNVDSLHLLRVLSMDDDLKSRIVAQAEKTVNSYMDTNKTTAPENIAATNQKMLSAVSAEPQTRSLMAQSDTKVYTQLRSLLRYNDSLSRLSIHMKDSVSRTTVQQLDSAMDLLGQLNVPIGWSCQSAPLSWFRSCDYNVQIAQHAAQTPGIIRYLQHRNATASDGNFWKYLLGIIISGFSLSFGAPFWFDLLAKLVNIRRAGKAPSTSGQKQ